MINKEKYIRDMRRWFKEQRLRISEEDTHIEYMGVLITNFRRRIQLAKQNSRCLKGELKSSQKDFAEYLKIDKGGYDGRSRNGKERR